MDKKKSKNKVGILPKLDAIDYFSITLWLGLLIPVLQLPLDASFTFLRTLVFILWVAVFAIYIAFRIYKEKRLVFYSASMSNFAIFGIVGSLVISYILSASSLDSLFGYNISFSSSFIFLFSTVVLYFLLRLAGLSLELQISRFLSTFPVALLIADVISVILFLIPSSVYSNAFGGFAQYFLFLTISPFALLGNLSHSALIHLLALVVVIYQLTQAKVGKTLSVAFVRKSVIAFILTLAGSYLVFFTYSGVQGLFGINMLYFYLIFILILGASTFIQKKGYSRKYIQLLGIVTTVFLLLGLLWNSLGFVGRGTTRVLLQSESSTIVKDSFMNSDTPIWRQIVGFGVGTFPYLYFQQRSTSAAISSGNETFFYKPSTYFSELFVEHGVLGLIAVTFLVFVVLKSFYEASNRSYMSMEITMLLVLIALGMFSSSFILFIVLFMVTLAAYFDKVESLPETLKRIRAIEIKESLYTNRSVNKSGVALLVIACVYAVLSLGLMFRPSMAIFGYSRAFTRYNAGNSFALSGEDKDIENAFISYNDAFSLATRYQTYCADCSQLTLLQATTLLKMKGLYSGLTNEQKAQSTELQRINTLLAQVLPALTNKNSLRYDYWITSAQAYRDLATEESSNTVTGLAVQSVKNALSVNPHSVSAHYLYIDILLSLGNSSQVNTVIYTQLNQLKELVGAPIQVQILDAIMIAREGNYDQAITQFDSIKTAIDADAAYTDEQKASIKALIDSRLSEVNAAKGALDDADQTTKEENTQESN